jgi:hypothetical protein
VRQGIGANLRRGMPVLGACAAAALAWPSLAQEGVPRVLLDYQLQPRAVRLISIDTRNITSVDARGLMQTESLEQYVAMVPGADEAAPLGVAQRPAVELSDGRRFVGLPTGRAGDTETLEWKAAEFESPLSIPLEDIRRVRLRPGTAPAGAATARDALVLINGDVIEGFVESIGDPTRMDHDSGPVDIPLERIAEVRLGGPERRPEGMRLWLRSGTVAGIVSITTHRQGGGFEFLLPGDGQTEADAPWRRGAAALDDLRAAAFDLGRLTPLASLGAARETGGPDRVFAEPLRIGESAGAVLDAADIEFPGPMSATWALPAGAVRLGGIAEIPEDSRAWGDCVLVFSTGPDPAQEVYRAALSGKEPRVEFSIALPGVRGATLTATVEAGPYGPIQDRVVLRRAVVLLSDRPGEAPDPRPAR